jgi:hypothetical protein
MPHSLQPCILSLRACFTNSLETSVLVPCFLTPLAAAERLTTSPDCSHSLLQCVLAVESQERRRLGRGPTFPITW